jgi:prepilin-type N-terminal cleavage/methylation domain-containing protein
VPIRKSRVRKGSTSLQGTLTSRLRGERGMTMTELMVTLSVMAVLFGIAVPTIQFQIARQELRSAAREVVEVLRGTRDAALNEGVPRYVLFSEGDPPSYRVYRFDGEEWVPDRNGVPFDASITFSEGDITTPALTDVPEAGASVPTTAVYFGTRGRYPHGCAGCHDTQTITLHGRMGRSTTLEFFPQTGQVSNP